MSLIQKPPTSGTKQENSIEEVLRELGLRFEKQASVGKYFCDFRIQEVPYVVEADGIYGHLKKADKKRDEDLMSMGIQKIIHIKSSNIEEIKKILLREIFDIGEEDARNQRDCTEQEG